VDRLLSPAAAGASRSPKSWVAVPLAFFAIYVIWGSTYLAIRFGVESLPPFLMAGVRFVVPGAVLVLWARMRGATAATSRQWRSAGIVGTFLLLGGNGIVTWAEQWVPSGLTALIIASVPIWMGLMTWMIEPAARPRAQGIAGLLLGFAGVAILVDFAGSTGGDGRLLPGSLSLLLAAAFWAAGSLVARRIDLPENLLLSTGMQMLGGSAALLLTGTLLGEWGRLDLGAVTVKSLLALGYLIVFGSIVAFSAYVYLLRATTPAKVSTYAYVNPTVAVLLGWALADEAITERMLVAAAIIVTSVIMITTERTESGIRTRSPASRPGGRGSVRGDRGESRLERLPTAPLEELHEVGVVGVLPEGPKKRGPRRGIVPPKEGEDPTLLQ
jgi:drug/metabolite transporter (DMT)-like permease